MKRLVKLNNPSGSSLQGYLKGSYADLVKLFGAPHETMGDKVQAEWMFFDKETKVRFTIYDYKEYQAVEKVTDWHIGGDSQDVLATVQSVLKEANAFEFVVSKGW